MENIINLEVCVESVPAVRVLKPRPNAALVTKEPSDLGKIYNEAFTQYIDELVSEGKDENAAIMQALKITFPAIHKAVIKQKSEKSIIKYVKDTLLNTDSADLLDAS